MCYYIGIEDLAANALILLLQMQTKGVHRSFISYKDIERYGSMVLHVLNAYCYWLGQLSFDSTSSLNVILSLQKKDITRHAGELSKIISYIHWMIDRRKETITNKRNWAS